MKKLGIKRLDAGIYEVINHDWPADNGPLEIYKSYLGGWRSSYCDSLFSTLSEAKASTFVALENDGLGVIA